ncbi:hypothetical protein [Terracidiphilus gabretensis]|uniref:hypothetical protein n=1 Tax=Terracidiphilus gabretensis TaxID=1577687 RepID=UPI00071C1079|nr:hypothetical protein [Terracidiphilus gabretensis]
MSTPETNPEPNAEGRIESFGPVESTPSLTRSGATRSIGIAFLVTALILAAFIYRVLRNIGMMHTSLIFLGIPLILGALLAMAPRPKSATGGILRGIALALLIVAPLVGEGYLCILFASPLFFGVGLLVGGIIDISRKHKRTVTLSCVIVLLPFTLEGTTPQLSFNRTQFATATRIVNAPAAQIVAALAQSPQIAAPLPRFLRIGFPRPLSATGSGLAIGSVRVIHFTGAEGDPPGDLTMRVVQSDLQPASGHIHFETINDSSKLTQWLRWRSSDVSWQAIDSTHTAITWRIGFDRQLDPYWYFAPWEQLAVHQAAGYLITANTMPHGQPGS